MERIECIPNFSTSDLKVVKQILNEFKTTKKAFLLDYTVDNCYNGLVAHSYRQKTPLLEDCVKFVRKFGRTLAQERGMLVHLYGETATKQEKGL